MFLERIELRDFKAYEAATFDFPVPERDGGKNVILIGGLNGYGKTSLFEALALGLFGRDGIRLIARAKPAGEEPERAKSFKDFIERALYGGALREGRTSCRIRLRFVDERKEPLEIQRTWHFTAEGKFQAGAEDVRILKGHGRSPIGPPSDEADLEGWYREWIHRTFLPINQASFFLFDGEAASVYAERDMGQKVKESIEGLLGLNWLRRLADDLRDYAINRRQAIPHGSKDEIARLESEIAILQSELSSRKKRIGDIEQSLADKEEERDRLVRELSGYGPGTQAQLEELIQEQEDQERRYEEARAQLEQLTATQLPFALVGGELRSRVLAQLKGEAARERWLAARDEGRARIDRVVTAVDRALDTLFPPLLPDQRRGVRDAVVVALDHLWHPPPDDVATESRHAHAAGAMSDRVRARLERAESLAGDQIDRILRTMAGALARLRDLRREIDSIKLLGPEVEDKRERLRRLNAEIEGLNREKGELNGFVRSKEPELAQKRKELARLTAALQGAEPASRRAARAEEIAQMLDELVAEAWPLHADAIAQAMTDGIRRMAHRSDYLHRVEITREGSLKLFTKDGRDLREFDLSAGEKQIFTQSLFSAVAKVSGRIFPSVIDTPIGRLDDTHRINVLRHLADRSGQVIMLSTNTEVVGPYLAAVRERVAKAYILESRAIGDLRVTRPVEGYFPGEAL